MHFWYFQLTVGLSGHNPIQSRGTSVCAMRWTVLMIKNAWMFSQNGFPKWVRETCEWTSCFLILLNIVQKSWDPTPLSTKIFFPSSVLPPLSTQSVSPSRHLSYSLSSFSFSGHFSPPIFLFCFPSFIVATKCEMFHLRQGIATEWKDNSPWLEKQL